jgi:hypothetical protein
MVRLLPEQATSLDVWRAKQTDCPGRPEAIRRLIAQALRGSAPVGPPSGTQRAKAADLATRELTKLGDKSLPAEEQQHRKRQLVRGPKEFRDIQGDQRKTRS